VRTAAVSATLGALLGLAAGYFLWGMELERPSRAGLPVADAAALAGPSALARDAAPAAELSADAATGTGAPAETGAATEAGGPTGQAEVRRDLRVVSTPSGAAVRIDGEEAGRTPLQRAITGEAPITVSLELHGHQPWSRRLTGAELEVPLEVVLQPVGAARRGR
jgi:hypothetical protein